MQKAKGEHTNILAKVYIFIHGWSTEYISTIPPELEKEYDKLSQLYVKYFLAVDRFKAPYKQCGIKPPSCLLSVACPGGTLGIISPEFKEKWT
jgi:hypothetical protein